MTRPFRQVWILLAAFAALHGIADAQCVEVVDAKDQPSVRHPEVDVLQVIRLTKAGEEALDDRFMFGYIEITRPAGDDRADGNKGERAVERFVRLVEKVRGQTPSTPFTFSREVRHVIRLFGATDYAWPLPPDFDAPSAGSNRPVLLCGDQPPVTIDVAPPVQRPDFTGVRGQWWISYHPLSRPGIGAALFIGRWGFAASAEYRFIRSFREPDDPNHLNPVVGVFELRYRGSRGYLGGGVRYFPDDEVNRDSWRVGAFAGEELPTWKGRRMWLVGDVMLDERRKNFVKGLNLSVGIRLDLWGSPP